jgi:hypothetical protein
MFQRARVTRLEHFDHAANFAISGFGRRLFEAHHGLAACSPHSVDRLVRGDCVDPRAGSSSRLGLADLQLNLQKRRLEHIVGEFGVSDIAAKVSVELTLIPSHQRAEHLPLTGSQAVQQFLVGTVGQWVVRVHRNPVSCTNGNGKRFINHS